MASQEPTKKRGSRRGGGRQLDKPLAEAKKEALNLFEEEERKAEKRRDNKGAKSTNQESKDQSLFKKLGSVGAGNPVAPPPPVDEPKAKAVEEIPEPVAAEPEEPAVEEEEEIDPSKIINIKPPIIVTDLAELMGIKPFKLIKDLMEMDVFASQNQSIEPDVAAQVCEKHGFVFEREKREKGAGVHKVEEVIEEPKVPEVVEEEKLKLRPPIVTFMGHVDHGKTSLLDQFRGSRVVEGEAGGITQHIGAYSVERNGQRVTFLDTPGHEAFTAMRARGATVTDIVVLVIAADDGIMPTTREAMDHAKAAGVTIVVAINKVDLPAANVDKVKGQLQDAGLSPEDWGGNTICVEVSAKTGAGLDDLFDMIGLQAEVLELKANPEGPARGTVIEARMEAGKGPTATVVIQSGTLKVGMPFICGNYSGKVKSMLSDIGKITEEAGPATPVEVLGFSGVPGVGDELVQMESDRASKKLSEERLESERQEKLGRPKRASLEALFADIDEVGKKTLKVILKTDVQGSAEAIVGALNEINSDKISLEVIHTAAGPVTESDVLLASASDAIIIGFNTKVENKAVSAAKKEGVQVKLYSIIYELIDQVKDAMLGMLEPETRENVLGHAQIREVFKLSSGRVGGCVVIDGRVNRKARARVLRGDQPVYDGGFQTLRRFKEDVEEVRNGLECGIRLGDFNDYMKDDIIECYELEKIQQTL